MERQAANVLHLLDLCTKGTNAALPMQLLEWLTYEKERQTIDSDTSEMRLETDAETVTITTIHSSKGLEYPVVFLPYLWNKAYGKQRKSSGGPYPIYADPGNPTQRILQLQPFGSEVTRATEIIALEDLQEAMRLLYVAFTRAELRCVVYGGEIQDFERSALAHLLFADPTVYENQENSALLMPQSASLAQAPELHFSVIEATENAEKWDPVFSRRVPLVQAFSRSKSQYLPRPDSFSRVAETITLNSEQSTTDRPTSMTPQPSDEEQLPLRTTLILTLRMATLRPRKPIALSRLEFGTSQAAVSPENACTISLNSWISARLMLNKNSSPKHSQPWFSTVC